MAVEQPLSDTSPEEQLRAACAELHRRLGAGRPCRAVELLAAAPALAADPDLAVTLILAELSLRRRLGEGLVPEQWYARFPQWRDRLVEHFPGPVPGGAFSSTPSATQPGASVLTGLERPPRPDGLGRAGLRYELLGELGHGGMGVVYRARDTLLDRVVALKKIRSGGWANPDEVQRFNREARAIARLQHEHIVPLYDFGEDEGQPYFTMRYLSGGSLADQLVHFADDPGAAVALVEKVARAVQAAHAQGIIHRDLKPSNVLLDEHGEPQVTDFGLAKFLEGGADATHSGQLLGTPAYMAPEQAAGQAHRATAASDVWSLGVILYELLTGRRPFRGTGPEMAERVRQESPPRPRSVKPELDSSLEAIVLRCLEKGPADRYGSSGDLAEDLRRWRCGERIRPEPWLRTLRRPLGRRPRGAWLAALGGGILLLALTVSYSVPRPATPGAPSQTEEQRRQAEALAEVERDLAAGKPVTLVGETGYPRYWRWRADKNRPPWSRGERMEVGSWSLAMLELVPDPKCDHYRLSADIFQITAQNGHVGLYVMGGEVQTPQGPEQAFRCWSFADEGQFAHLRRLLDYRSCDSEPGQASRTHSVLNHRDVFDDPPGWHHLAVEVTPDKVIAFWEGKPVHESSRAVEERAMNSLWLDQAFPLGSRAYATHGSFGLFVDHCTAQFRNVVVEAHRLAAPDPEEKHR